MAILIFNQYKLDSKFARTTYGALYNEIDIKSRWALMFNVFYTLRRIMFAGVAFLGENYPFFQVQALSFQSIALIVYIGAVKPFEDTFTNKIEIFNEICILGASYHLITLTDYADDADLQYMTGWSLIAITTFNMLVNVIIMMFFSIGNLIKSIKNLLNKFREWIKKRQLNKLNQNSKVQKYQDKTEDYRKQDDDEIDGSSYQIVNQLESLKSQPYQSVNSETIDDVQNYHIIQNILPDVKSETLKRKKTNQNWNNTLKKQTLRGNKEFLKEFEQLQQQIEKNKGITGRQQDYVRRKSSELLNIFGNSKDITSQPHDNWENDHTPYILHPNNNNQVIEDIQDFEKDKLGDPNSYLNQEQSTQFKNLGQKFNNQYNQSNQEYQMGDMVNYSNQYLSPTNSRFNPHDTIDDLNEENRNITFRYNDKFKRNLQELSLEKTNNMNSIMHSSFQPHSQIIQNNNYLANSNKEQPFEQKLQTKQLAKRKINSKQKNKNSKTNIKKTL